MFHMCSMVSYAVLSSYAMLSVGNSSAKVQGCFWQRWLLCLDVVLRCHAYSECLLHSACRLTLAVLLSLLSCKMLWSACIVRHFVAF